MQMSVPIQSLVTYEDDKSADDRETLLLSDGLNLAYSYCIHTTSPLWAPLAHLINLSPPLSSRLAAFAV